MASNSRAERRRNERAAAKRGKATRAGLRMGHDYADHAVLIAWCADDPAALEEAKRRTHDGLIASMGDRRRGGVAWQIHKESAADVADDLLATAGPNEPQEVRDHYRRLRAHVREYGGCLVIAHAPGVPGR